MAAWADRCSISLSTMWRFSAVSSSCRCSYRSKSASTLLWSCLRTVSAFMHSSFPARPMFERLTEPAAAHHPARGHGLLDDLVDHWSGDLTLDDVRAPRSCEEPTGGDDGNDHDEEGEDEE